MIVEYQYDHGQVYRSVCKEALGLPSGSPSNKSVVRPTQASRLPLAPLGSPKASRISDSYIADMLAQGAMRWPPGSVLKVYISQAPVWGWKRAYDTFAEDALREWNAAGSGVFKLVRTALADDAHIMVEWVPSSSGVPQGAELGVTRVSTWTRPGSAVVDITHAHVSILTRLAGREISDSDIKKTLLHELGHALGLQHSREKSDIMFPQSSAYQMESLNVRDASTIRSLYRL